MKIYAIEVVTNVGRRVKRAAPMNVDACGDMPPLFRSLTEMLWREIPCEAPMKIYTIEALTDMGRRVIKLAAPMDVDARGDMPPPFRSLTEMLWGLVREIAVQAPSPTTPKAEA